MREVRALEAGTATFGTFGNAPYYLLSDLVQDFRKRYPNVRVRLIGQNSSEVAEAVRDGQHRGRPDRAPDRRPRARRQRRPSTTSCSTSRKDPERAKEPMTIERLAEAPLILYDARFGWDDPTRRQLAERAQRAGVTIEPQIEVEYVEAALDLALRGLGDTIGTRGVALRPRLHAAAPLGRRSTRPVRRHVRLHHAPQRAPLPGHPRVHGAGGEAHGGAAIGSTA